jgi:hypothetical protein
MGMPGGGAFPFVRHGRERERVCMASRPAACNLVNGTLSVSLARLLSMHAVPLPEQTRQRPAELQEERRGGGEGARPDEKCIPNSGHTHTHTLFCVDVIIALCSLFNMSRWRSCQLRSLSLKTSKMDRKELTIICMWMSNIMRSFSHFVLPLHHSKKAGWLAGWMDGWMQRPPLAGNMKRMHVCTAAERLWFDIAMQMHAPSDKLPSHKSLPASLLTCMVCRCSRLVVENNMLAAEGFMHA